MPGSSFLKDFKLFFPKAVTCACSQGHIIVCCPCSCSQGHILSSAAHALARRDIYCLLLPMLLFAGTYIVCCSCSFIWTNISLLPALAHGDKFFGLADIFGGRTHDTAVIELVLQVMGNPAGDSRCGKQRGEQFFRDSQHMIRPE